GALQAKVVAQYVKQRRQRLDVHGVRRAGSPQCDAAHDRAFNCRAMNAFTISRARSVCGPGVATHSCSLPSNSWYWHSPPAALYVATNFSCTAETTLSSKRLCMISYS